MTSYRLTFITPLFSKGSYDDRPEVRPSSIRGQLHWWFRALGGNYADEKAVFGGVHNGATASKVVVRVANVTGQTAEIPTLPHKFGGQASPKCAYRPGTTAEVHFALRLGGLDERLAAMLDRTIEAWLLVGTLGLRATRAGGSFVWEPLTANGVGMPGTLEDYAARCRTVLRGAPLRFVLSPKPFPSAEAARRVVSDTLGGRDDPRGVNDLKKLRDPLGKVFGGRKTSPLRFRIIQLGEVFHIAAVWDDRSAVTGNKPGDFKAVVDLLASRDKEIGRLLQAALGSSGTTNNPTLHPFP
ncbi:MAG: type III-B CRISPR module RAMP protein Cmr1 [Verrucomicrobia bacterium]|nr:MAG: type III-B CRISPR module RAMP protein Cmr1 [Verrucomicrobiota bacterium]